MIRFFVLLAAAALPFSKALTVDLKFPLKISEVSLAAASLLLLLRLHWSADFFKRNKPIFISVVVFWLYLLINVFFRALFPVDGMNMTGFQFRYGLMGDPLAKIIYLVLDIIALAFFALYFQREPEKISKAWFVGAVLAGAYGVYLFLSSWKGVSPYILPGLKSPQIMNFGNHALMRAGTFEEGNFFGFFLFLTTVMAVQFNRTRLGICLSLISLMTLSTVTFICFTFFWALVIVRKLLTLKSKKKWVLISVCSLFLLGVLGLMSKTSYVQEVIIEKLVGWNSTSRRDRMAQIQTGLKMFADHPLTGIGLSLYGYYFNSYKEIDDDLNIHLGGRLIPNNVYVELLSETGLMGLGLFIFFLWQLERRCRMARLKYLQYGFWGTIIYLNAYPSFASLFLWGFFGAIVGLSTKALDQQT